MDRARISIIAAVSENKAIGKANKLLWHIKEDMKRFKALTSGHPVIMGRKIHESIGRPLPNRTNLIITRNSDYKAEGCIVVNDLVTAIEKAQEIDKAEIFILGGGEIYKQAIETGVADRLYLTLVKGTFDADTFFPEYSTSIYSKEIERVEGKTEDGIEYTFLTVEK